MRSLIALPLLAVALVAGAQSQPRPQPPGTRPLDEPPPGPIVEPDPSLRPQVTIRREGDQDVTEYRVNGKLYMMRVTPKTGKPYVLMDHKGDGVFSKQDNTLTPHLAVPQWVIAEF